MKSTITRKKPRTSKKSHKKQVKEDRKKERGNVRSKSNRQKNCDTKGQANSQSHSLRYYKQNIANYVYETTIQRHIDCQSSDV
jgi:hypothetical protein